MECGNGPHTHGWVRRSIGWPISIGKSNTPLLRMHPFTVSIGEDLICVLVLSKSCGPLCGGWPRGA